MQLEPSNLLAFNDPATPKYAEHPDVKFAPATAGEDMNLLLHVIAEAGDTLITALSVAARIAMDFLMVDSPSSSSGQQQPHVAMHVVILSLSLLSLSNRSGP